MQQHDSIYFARIPTTPPPPTLGMGSIGQNSTFSEHCHVQYQIIENHKCSNMVANILLADPLRPPTRGMELIFQNSTFSEHGRVAYQINGNHETQQMFCPQTPLATTLGGGVKRSKFNCFRTWSCCISNLLEQEM